MPAPGTTLAADRESCAGLGVCEGIEGRREEEGEGERLQVNNIENAPQLAYTYRCSIHEHPGSILPHILPGLKCRLLLKSTIVVGREPHHIGEVLE